MRREGSGRSRGVFGISWAGVCVRSSRRVGCGHLLLLQHNGWTKFQELIANE